MRDPLEVCAALGLAFLLAGMGLVGYVTIAGGLR